MRIRALTLSLALLFAGVATAIAQSPELGTWKLDAAKSKLPAHVTHVNTATYEAQGDQVKVTSEAISGTGNPMHVEWVGKYDGKDYPVTGDPSIDTRSYTQVDEHTLMLTNKKDGKTVMSVKIVTSPDGKTRTVHMTGTDSSGKPISGTAVYDKQ